MTAVSALSSPGVEAALHRVLKQTKTTGQPLPEAVVTLWPHVTLSPADRTYLGQKGLEFLARGVLHDERDAGAPTVPVRVMPENPGEEMLVSVRVLADIYYTGADKQVRAVIHFTLADCQKVATMERKKEEGHRRVAEAFEYAGQALINHAVKTVADLPGTEQHGIAVRLVQANGHLNEEE